MRTTSGRKTTCGNTSRLCSWLLFGVWIVPTPHPRTDRKQSSRACFGQHAWAFVPPTPRTEALRQPAVLWGTNRTNPRLPSARRSCARSPSRRQARCLAGPRGLSGADRRRTEASLGAGQPQRKAPLVVFPFLLLIPACGVWFFVRAPWRQRESVSGCFSSSGPCTSAPIEHVFRGELGRSRVRRRPWFPRVELQAWA